MSMMVAAIVSNIEMNHKSVIFHPNRMKLVPKPMFLRSGSMIKQSRIVKNNLLSLYGIHDDDSLCFKQGNYTSVTYLSLLKIPNRALSPPASPHCRFHRSIMNRMFTWREILICSLIKKSWILRYEINRALPYTWLVMPDGIFF